jgi:hypothetical protein
VFRTELNTLLHMSISMIPCHFFGSLRSPFFGTGMHWLLCHPAWSVFPSKKSETCLCTIRCGVSFIAFSASGGMPLSPGLFPFFSLLMAVLTSLNVIGAAPIRLILLLDVSLMDRNVVLGGERMPHRCKPFQWPCGGVEAIHAASPDAACPRLQRKPLDIAIKRLLTLYLLGGLQGDSKQINDVLCTHIDGHLDGHRDAAVLYRVHHLIKEVQVFIKATKHCHRASTCSDSINRTRQRRLFLRFHREKGLELRHVGP